MIETQMQAIEDARMIGKLFGGDVPDEPPFAFDEDDCPCWTDRYYVERNMYCNACEREGAE